MGPDAPQRTRRLPRALAVCLLFGGIEAATASVPPLPPADPPTVETYECKYSQRVWTLTPDPARVLVRLHDGASEESWLDLVALYELAEDFAPAAPFRVGVYEVPGGVDSHRFAAALVTHPEVSHARALRHDDEGFPQYVVPGELTVQFHPGVPAGRREEILASIGSQVVRAQRTGGYFTIAQPEGSGLYATIRALNLFDEIAFAEESSLSFDSATFIPDDPLFPDQWHLENTGQNGGTPGADLDIDPAWDLEAGDPDVVIVVIDTGADLDHPDLAPNLYPRDGEDWNFANATETVPEDTDGHGTSCAGLAVAVAGNGLGGAGVCPDCRFIPLEIDLSSGANQNRADAIHYALDFQIAHPELRLVLSNSWKLSSGSFAAVEAACQRAFDEGVPILFAAGNVDLDVDYPAAYPTTIAVGATSPCDERKFPGSCDGEPGWGSNTGPELSVVAPGVLMTTTALGAGHTGTFRGTSAACPLAAATLGLLLARDPSLTYAEAWSILESTAADEVGRPQEDTPGRDDYMGFGRIDAHAALLATPVPGPPTIASLAPAEGPIHRTTAVTVTGTEFRLPIEVRFDGTAAISADVIDETTLDVVAPSGVTLLPVDVEVTTDEGSAVAEEAYTYRPRMIPVTEARPGEPLGFFANGPPDGDWGAVVDTHPGPRTKKGLVWDIGFRDFTIIQNSFQTPDPPLSSQGQGTAVFLVPDDPALIGETLYAQAIFDGNGTLPRRYLTLSEGVEIVVVP